MNIQFLNGGLANQTFQYIFTRFMNLSSVQNELTYLDDSYFSTTTVHNGYEISKVFPNSKPVLISEILDKDIWDYVLENKRNGISLPQTFSDLSLPVTLLAEFDNYKQFNPFNGNILKIPSNQFTPDLSQITSQNSDNEDEIFYFHGYFLHPGYFNRYKDIFKEELSFRPIDSKDIKNVTYQDSIINNSTYSGSNSTSIAMHVRRGDFVKLGLATKDEFYYNAICEIQKKYTSFTIFVFSDDINWCKENKSKLGLSLIPNDRVVFVDGNIHGQNYIDLQLMSQCEILIFGNSSFGQLSYLLNKNLIECISECFR